MCAGFLSVRKLLGGKRGIRVSIRSRRIASYGLFLLELLVYAVFALVYFFLVIRLMGGWTKEIFDRNKIIYAFLALALIMGQGVLLDMLTRVLLWVNKRKGR